MRRALACAVAFAWLIGSAAGHADARIDYMLNCQGCHGPDGSGHPGNVPDLRGTLGRFLAVPGGRAYLVQVPGSRNASIDDAALAAVLNWMIASFGAQSVPRDFTAYTGSEVAGLRHDPPSSIAAERARLLAEIAADDARAP